MTRTVRESYSLFKQENPQMKIGLTKFYTLRPKWVLLTAPANSCLCIYCENFQLMLNALAKFTNVRNTEEIEKKPFSSIVCNVDNLNCIFQDCKQ